ncbi:MAG: DUF2461 domain-containing protein [Deltaproteobacteria bacterium]|nr:DUF2461 domain-containing protein [Deltaproteobacteria bacterium]
MAQKISNNPLKAQLFSFLRDLEANNQRDWFQAHKQRYEDALKEPALRFINDFGPNLRRISPHFNAIPKATGGSLFRIYRDTRFSKDKTPYKTHAGIQFRHKQCKDAHAPGFYLHLQPSGSFIGLGIWRPDGPSLKKIRQSLMADPAGWKEVVGDSRFAEAFTFGGESLKRPPRGVPGDHPLMEDLKRKDFIGVTNLSQKRVLAPDFLDDFTACCEAGAPLVRYLCAALEVPF